MINVRDHGAAGDGVTNDTRAVQEAINLCHRAGGGPAHVPPGVYLCGTLFLESGVELHLDAGATLLASPDRADYDTSRNVEHDRGLDDEKVGGEHFIYARDAQNIAITGRGKIDGHGRVFYAKLKSTGWRPGQLVTFVNCRDVLLRDVTIVDSPYWTVWPLGCERVTINHVTILNDRHGRNADGIDPDCCRDVRISNCHIEAGDDCIAVRSDAYRLGDPGRPCERVCVTNCTLSTRKCGVRLGYAGDAPIRNCTFSNLVMFNTRTGLNIVVPRDARPQEHFVVEHGPSVENVTFSNIVMETEQAFYFWIGDEASAPGCIRNVQLSNIIATTQRACHIGGSRTIPIEGLRISDMRLTVRGEMDDGFAREVPYPYPVYGRWDTKGEPHAFYCRHVRDVVFDNVEVRWGDVKGPWGSAFRVEQAEGVLFNNVRAKAAPGSNAPAMRLTDVR